MNYNFSIRQATDHNQLQLTAFKILLVCELQSLTNQSLFMEDFLFLFAHYLVYIIDPQNIPAA